MMDSLVSVIIPVYNARNTIVRCVESVMKQTYKNLEVIVVDDGSTDGCCNLLEDYSSDSRIHVYSKENGGVSSARNFGLSKANGEFIQFVDSDDVIQEKCVESFLMNQKKADYDWVIGGYYYLQNQETVSLSDKCYHNYKQIREDFMELWGSTYINVPWNKLYKRTLCKDLWFDTTVTLGEDLLFNLEYLEKIQNMCVLSDCYYGYNLGEEFSLTKKYYDTCFEDFRRIALAVKSYLKKFDNEEEAQTASRILWHSYEHCVRTIILSSPIKDSEIDGILDTWRKDEILNKICEYIPYSFYNRLLMKAESRKIRFYYNYINSRAELKKYVKRILSIN